jgi:outer membrane protein
MKIKFLMTAVCLTALVIAVGVQAAEADDVTELLQPNFQFQHQHLSGGKSFSHDELLRGDVLSEPDVLMFDKNSAFSGEINQYDATISYPFSRHNVVSFDLGINLRFVDAELKGQNLDQTGTHINTTLPMLYANAFFNLPFKGMSASIGGSHLQYDDYFAFDYKAKLSYTWDNGFGLEGGWQHQRFNIDSPDVQADFETKGPFLDLKYRF